ncbi:neuropeptide FF receptor 2-like [Stylophora pistillata]|uniref:neuropeptide FF receptor 2-like n=1 Tax=Stylophora pistillata TaxID=50429 RepID=UPI000C0454A0|nr:neuropeptide FF receptor 2-like [Stylophora pistillata]
MANFSASTGSNSDVDPLLVSQLVIFAVIAPFIVVGNVFICWIELTRKVRRSSSYFILNLAISDLAVGLVSIPLDITELLADHWPFYGFVCKTVYPFQTVLMAVSVITLLCMTVERYRAVVTPFKSKPTSRCIIKVIISAWATSFLLVTPYTLVLRMKNDECVEDWPSRDHVKTYTVSVFSVLYLLPLTLITIFYTKIGLYVRMEARRWKSLVRYYHGTSIRQVQDIAQLRHMQNTKLIKAFVAAVMVFAVCQLPTHVFWLLHDFGTESKWERMDVIIPFAHILTYLNSAIDPFIFGSLDAQFLRKKVRSLFGIQRSEKHSCRCRASGNEKHRKGRKESSSSVGAEIQRFWNHLKETNV